MSTASSSSMTQVKTNTTINTSIENKINTEALKTTSIESKINTEALKTTSIESKINTEALKTTSIESKVNAVNGLVNNIDSKVSDFGLKWWDEIYTNKIEFITSGTFTTDASTTEVVIGICGGGGNYIVSISASGGGGSGMTYHKLSVIPNTNYTITIGAGSITTADGGNSSFDSLVTVLGGQTAPTQYISGLGRNGGGNGGTHNTTNAQACIANKVINGLQFSKLIQPLNMLEYCGGAGGGWDYEEYGRGGTNSTNKSTDGICVVWF